MNEIEIGYYMGLSMDKLVKDRLKAGYSKEEIGKSLFELGFSFERIAELLLLTYDETEELFFNTCLKPLQEKMLMYVMPNLQSDSIRQRIPKSYVLGLIDLNNKDSSVVYKNISNTVTIEREDYDIFIRTLYEFVYSYQIFANAFDIIYESTFLPDYKFTIPDSINDQMINRLENFKRILSIVIHMTHRYILYNDIVNITSCELNEGISALSQYLGDKLTQKLQNKYQENCQSKKKILKKD